MKNRISETENLFSGKWRIISVYGYVQEQGWTLFKKYGPNAFIWEFEQTKKKLYESGGIFYDGVLREHFRCSPKDVTEYSYSPTDRQLYIDRSDYEPNGFINICINDRYRVERIRGDEYWLYDLQDVETEPDDYNIRIKIRKID